jgi:2-succinyl-5-enolpyruvyl-6-hydroxy-3-cyclohexene-1-carboxylate synthase
MVNYQPIYDIAELCSQKGMSHAILCPGSRCAPLTIAFSRHSDIVTRSISDERSAGFIALGIAQQTKVPAVLLCTSGSAAYNFSPAVAEAFYQQIPLLVFTADRPKEWIDQLDGQTINQTGIYGSHCKKSFELPQDYQHADSQWHINRIINEAINLAREFPAGPVHINAPFREPLYPPSSETIVFSKSPRIIESVSCVKTLSTKEIEEAKKDLSSFRKIIIIAGQDDFNENLVKAVEKFAKQHHAVLIGDVISNLHSLAHTIRRADSFLAHCGERVKQSLQPELVITFGKSVISKNLKIFLRQNRPQHHWHIQTNGPVVDTYQTLTNIIRSTPYHFFTSLFSENNAIDFETQKKVNFVSLWEAEEHRTERSVKNFFSSPVLSELEIIKEVLKALPLRCNLHLANSMSVRYANFIGLEVGKKGIHVFANRGTSGIDGCTSTTIGHALASDVPNFLITGDMAFFYDRNAFWNNYPIPNLRVMVLNNHGGIIFSMIDGPGNVPEQQEYFVTEQKLTAKNLCEEFGFDYLKLDSLKKLKNVIKDFMDFDGKTKILEIESDQQLNIEQFGKFKMEIKKGYEA